MMITIIIIVIITNIVVVIIKTIIIIVGIMSTHRYAHTHTYTYTDTHTLSLIRSVMTFHDESPEAFLCVYVGRISKEKRLDVIVEAVRAVKGAYLAIIGDGPGSAFYAAIHGKESKIYCTPKFLSHKELAEVYASADIHVSASQFETLGNTVLEAFSCGIPVVVPRCQGFCDTVTDTKDGYLFTPGSSENAQKFIQMLKDDKEKRHKMGEFGRMKVSSHTVNHVVKDLILWYERGIVKRNITSSVRRIAVFIALLATVPIAIIALWCYERLVSAEKRGNMVNMVNIALTVYYSIIWCNVV